jgi:hypothetical protein
MYYSNDTVDTVKQLNKAGLLNKVLDFIDKNSVNYFETDLTIISLFMAVFQLLAIVIYTMRIGEI